MIKYYPPLYYYPTYNEDQVWKNEFILNENIESCSVSDYAYQYGSCTITIKQAYDPKNPLYDFEPYGIIHLTDDNRGADGKFRRFIVNNISDEVEDGVQTITLECLDMLSTLNWTSVVSKRDYAASNGGGGKHIKDAIQDILTVQSDNPAWAEFYWKLTDTSKYTMSSKDITKLIFDSGTTCGEAFMQLVKEMFLEMQIKIEAKPNIIREAGVSSDTKPLFYNWYTLMSGNISMISFSKEPTYVMPINMSPNFLGYHLERTVEGHVNRIWHKKSENEEGYTYIQNDNDRRTYGLREILLNDTKDKIPKDKMREISPSANRKYVWSKNGVQMKINILDVPMITKEGISKHVDIYDILTFRDGNNDNLNFIIVGIEKKDIINDPENIEITVMDCNDIKANAPDQYKPKVGGSHNSTDINNTEKQTFKYGDKVKITGTHYQTGGKIPKFVLSSTHTVDAVRGSKIRLKEIWSWVWAKDLKKV